MGSLDKQLLPWIDSVAFVLEVGSERGGGSTATIAEWAGMHGYRFVSIDVDPAQAGQVAGVEYVTDTAEHYLSGLTPECGLRFAYLDGFDWPYPPPILDRHELAPYERLYERLGLHLTQEDSQQSHLAISQELDRIMTQGTIIFDDTWNHDHWDGKGGTAVPFLLDRGWVLTHAQHNPPFNAYARLVKS